MAKTFRALSALLSYPTADLIAAGGEIGSALAAEAVVEPAARRDLQPLLDSLASQELEELQARYVELFDTSRRVSLYLFEHVHGESRDRGQAMVDLAALYATGGLTLAANELPDYLPLFLEYLSTRPLDESRALLADTAHILAALEARLQARNPAYAAVLSAIRSAAGNPAATVEVADEAEPDNLAALDAAWEETAVTFGPDNAAGGCSADRLMTRMRAMNRDVRYPA
jgi:nitrate reductase molybdenum cofactor assembly chaperone NarJ/NarW